MQGNGDYSPNYELIKDWVNHMNEQYPKIYTEKCGVRVDEQQTKTPDKVTIVHSIGRDEKGNYRVEWKVV